MALLWNTFTRFRSPLVPGFWSGYAWVFTVTIFTMVATCCRGSELLTRLAEGRPRLGLQLLWGEGAAGGGYAALSAGAWPSSLKGQGTGTYLPLRQPTSWQVRREGKGERPL